MPTRFIIGQKRGGRVLYLTGISAPLSSRVKDAQQFETRAEAERALADYLDENVFGKPWLSTDWQVAEVNR